MKIKTDFVDYNGTIQNKTNYVGNTYPFNLYGTEPVSSITRYNASHVAFSGSITFINEMLDILQDQFTNTEVKFNIVTGTKNNTFLLHCKLSDEAAAMFEFAMIVALSTYSVSYHDLLSKGGF